MCFRSDYSNATDLHIAVTTSGGDIVEFDRDGLQRHRRDDNPRDWWQSLLVGDVPEPWHYYWDEVLEQVSVACVCTPPCSGSSGPGTQELHANL